MTLWGGRFTESPEQAVWEFTASTADRRLLADDIAGSIAHVTMLGAAGILAADEVGTIVEGLETIAGEQFEFADTDEDVHTAVERRLIELVGDVGAKLHTGRSRNDQVALDLRLYLKRQAGLRREQLTGLITALLTQAEAAGDTVVAAYTHLQQSQAVPFAHYLLAHAWPLLRDIDRFTELEARLDVSPLGAGAGGGSRLALQPSVTASALGMADTFDNSLDAVATRDFVAEYGFCCAQALANCSRLAAELVLWSSSEFGWVAFGDAHTTGSSALPHKKNPDVAELVRGKAASAAGAAAALLGIQKGLPLAYNRDLQEDKSLVFAADDALAGALPALMAMVAGAAFHPPPPTTWVTFLDLAEVLVERGVPFREAHEAVGGLVRRLTDDGRDPDEATAADLAALHPLFSADDLDLLDPAVSVAQRKSPGGGSMASVGAQLEKLRSGLS